MKFIIDDSNYIVFHHKIIKDKDKLEDYLNNIFRIIKDKYKININGYYDINIYTNNNYGQVIEMKKEDLSYYDLFSNKIEMQVNIIDNCPFLLQIEDYLMNSIYINKDVFKFNDKLYIKIEDIKDITMYENGTIIYGEEAKKIM